MFNNKEKITADQISNSSNIIGQGASLCGDIEAYGNIRIEGKVIGTIKTKSKIALGQSSYVEGNIYAQNAEIAGEVKGKIEIKELLILKPSSVVNGNIKANNLLIESGAIFNGGCKMELSNKEEKVKEVKLVHKYS